MNSKSTRNIRTFLNDAEIAEITPSARKTAAVPAARKSLMGKWKQVGAPPKEIIGLTKSPSRAKFTKDQIFERNGRTVSLLTIDKRIKALVKARKLVKLADTVKSDKPGRPAYCYTFDLSKAPAKKTRKAKTGRDGAVATQTGEHTADVNPAPVETVAQPAATPAPTHVEETTTVQA